MTPVHINVVLDVEALEMLAELASPGKFDQSVGILAGGSERFLLDEGLFMLEAEDAY